MYTPGCFVGHSLNSTNLAAAAAFYAEVLGWTSKKVGAGMQFLAGGKAVAWGEQASSANPRSAWLAHVSVTDVDAAAAAAKARGGKVLLAPTDFPVVGRCSMIADPLGAVLGLRRAPVGDPDRAAQSSPGEFCGETLATTDIGASKGFYTAVIGWTSPAASDGHPDVFKASGTDVATIVREPGAVATYWLSVAFVPKIADACGRATRARGTVMSPPTALLGGGTFAIIRDPAGADLGIFEAASE